MSSEAKVLVPGVPGHHAPIKPAPLSQPKEVENKRKLGSNEVMTAYMGLRLGGVGGVYWVELELVLQRLLLFSSLD